jgi:hypothetical protein
VKGKPSQILVEELKTGSSVLERLNNFKKISTKMKIMTIYKRLPTVTAIATSTGEWKREVDSVIMVKAASTCLYWPNGKFVVPDGPQGCCQIGTQ